MLSVARPKSNPSEEDDEPALDVDFFFCNSFVLLAPGRKVPELSRNGSLFSFLNEPVGELERGDPESLRMVRAFVGGLLR